MDPKLLLMLIVGAVLFGTITLTFVLAVWMYQRIDQDTALVINTAHGPRVSFVGAVVLPRVQHAERVSLALHAIIIDRRGAAGFVCRDQIRVDLRATFLVRVNRTSDDVLKAAATVGAARTSDPAALQAIFAARFTAAIEMVTGQREFEDLRRDRELLHDEIVDRLGDDLHGYVLSAVAIDHIEHTPIDQLDPNNLSDAEAIRRLTEQISARNIRANELRMREAADLAHQRLIADEERLHGERRRAELEAHHRQQIALSGLSPPPPAGR